MTTLQTVNLGTPPTAVDGDTVRGAMTKMNANVAVLNSQAALVSNAATLTAAQALTAAHVGKRVNISLAAAGTINLPTAAAMGLDGIVHLRNVGTTLVTLAIAVGSGDTLSLTKLAGGESAIIDSDGTHALGCLMRGRTNSDNETVAGNSTVSGSLTSGSVVNVGGTYSGAGMNYVPSAANSSGYVTARPSGTGTIGGFQAFAGSDSGNSAYVTMYMSGANAIINTSKTGTAGATPLDIYTNSNLNWRFYASSTGQTNSPAQFSTPVVAGALHLGGAPQYGLVMQSSGTAANKYWLIGPNTNNNYCVFDQGAVGVYLVDGSTAWGSQSDERLKNIRSEITDAVEAIKDIRTVRYSWKSDDDHAEALGVTNDSRVYVGVIAQDVQRHVPEAVSVSHDEYLGVAYTDLVPLCMAAIKELSAKLDSAQAQINALQLQSK